MSPIASYSTTISLLSGGQLTLTFNGSLFQISKEDRDFVYSLMDMMRTHVETPPAGEENP